MDVIAVGCIIAVIVVIIIVFQRNVTTPVVNAPAPVVTTPVPVVTTPVPVIKPPIQTTTQVKTPLGVDVPMQTIPAQVPIVKIPMQTIPAQVPIVKIPIQTIPAQVPIKTKITPIRPDVPSHGSKKITTFRMTSDQKPSDQKPSDQKPTVPKTPSWVIGDPQKESKENRRVAGKRNAAIVKKANDSHTRYDFVLYGDSITQYVGDKYMDIWNKYFGSMKSAPLGVAGNTVEELSWRVAIGQEKFTIGPKVVAILIGINNITHSKSAPDPTPHLDEFLIPWMRATWPTTKIILMSLLPNATVSVSSVNQEYAKLASKYGLTYVTCGSTLNAKDPKMFKDGTHPAPAGYEVIYACLRDTVKKLL